MKASLDFFNSPAGKYHPANPALYQKPSNPPSGASPNWWMTDDVPQNAKGQPMTKQIHSAHKPVYVHVHQKGQKPPAPMPPGPKLPPMGQQHKPHPLAQVQQAEPTAMLWIQQKPKPKPKPQKPGPKNKHKLPPPQGPQPFPMAPMTVQEYSAFKATHAALLQQHAQAAAAYGAPPGPGHGSGLTAHQHQTLKWLEAAAQQELTEEDDMMSWAPTPGGPPAELFPVHGHGQGAGGEGAHPAASAAAQQFNQRRRRDARDRVEAVARDLIARLERFRDGTAAALPPMVPPELWMRGSDPFRSGNDVITVERFPKPGTEPYIKRIPAGSAEDPFVVRDNKDDPTDL
jgi:hypothetical protein